MNPSIRGILPPFPTWETAHPLAVHLPLGILAAVPVLAVWAMLAGSNRRTVGWAVMLLLLMGTTGTVVAAMSGQAAEEVAEVSGGAAAKLLDRHGEMGELARNCFLGVSGAYAVITIVSTILNNRIKRPVWIVVHALWLIGLVGALLVLANAGHMGGRLVHEFGVRAPMNESGAAGH